mmetsp:Transcript_11428/g.18619  ORF Transcript_11428/g.18619 Transcript_11428/m.18619 type:complete len:428 (+) Transcript_11428:155-1438(+)
MNDQSKSKEKPFGCTYPGCFKHFARKDCQQLHIKTHTGEKTYFCDTLVKTCGCETDCEHEANVPCGKYFITSSHLNRHKRTHRDLFVHRCDFCSCKYKKKSQLRQHKLDVHGLAEFLCEEDGCGRHFVSKAKLIIHQKARHGGYMCPVITCSAMFASNSALMDHIAGHDSNVTLIQKRARKRSKTSADAQPSLERGQSDGIDVEDGTGMLCAGGSYLDDDDDYDDSLDRQAAWLLGTDGAEEEEDDNDDDVFFIGHVRDGRRKRARSLSVSSDCGPPAPTQEKSFKCQHPGCNRSFNQKKNLDAHCKALHSLIRPYPCPEPYCCKSFGFKSVLERHMLRRHGRVTTGTALSGLSTATGSSSGNPSVTTSAEDGSVISMASLQRDVSTPFVSTEAANEGDGVCRPSDEGGKSLWNNILGVNFASSHLV